MRYLHNTEVGFAETPASFVDVSVLMLLHLQNLEWLSTETLLYMLALPGIQELLSGEGTAFLQE